MSKSHVTLETLKWTEHITLCGSLIFVGEYVNVGLIVRLVIGRSP